MGDHMPADPVTELAAGFTESQAMRMVCAILTSGLGGDQ